MPELLMMSSLRFGLLAATLLTACSIRLEEGDVDAGQDAECLELFETCVELAGESPGCTEVFQFCQGSASPTGTGGAMPGSCEQNYIDCLAEGSTANDCQPLLDACMPSGSSTGCEPLEPTCGMVGDADTTDDSDGETGCAPGSPDCPGTDCDARFDDCLNTLGTDKACDPMRDACLQGDCETALSVCLSFTEDSNTCSELTGCELDPPTDPGCDELLANCESRGLSSSECARLYPEQADCFPEPQGCEWYEGACYDQYNGDFCAEARDACEVGVLPQMFDCAFIASACDPAELTESACSQAQQSCETGFFDIENCTQTPLSMDPLQWLNELALCNGWM